MSRSSNKWQVGKYDEDVAIIAAHSHTLVNRVALKAQEAKNKAHKNKAGESQPQPTPEFGLQMVQSGHNAYPCHLAPYACSNVEETLCLVQGCHTMHAVRYVNREEHKKIVAEWNLERINPV